MLTIILIPATLSEHMGTTIYKYQLEYTTHNMVFVNSFAYNSVNVWNRINLEVRICLVLKLDISDSILMELAKTLYVFKCFNCFILFLK